MASANCKSCKNTYKEYKEEGYELDPPCDRCFPSIHPYNRATYEVYVNSSSQLILGFDGAVSINILAIDLVIDRLNSMGVTDIEEGDKLELYNDVNQLFNVIKETSKRNTKAKSKKKKK
jgi:hypothetical protein